MRHIRNIVWMLAFVAVAYADTVVVKGELSFNSKGIGKVLDCNSGRIFSLGVMATNPYRRMIEQYWRLSYHGKTPVLIEVRGDASNSETGWTLQSPNVATLVAGRCSDTEKMSWPS
jgi:hypothetical protein